MTNFAYREAGVTCLLGSLIEDPELLVARLLAKAAEMMKNAFTEPCDDSLQSAPRSIPLHSRSLE